MDSKYWDNYFDLFVTPGWKQYVTEAQENYDAIDLENCGTWDKYMVARTEKIMLKKIIRFEELLRQAYDNVTKELDLDIEQ